jgi:hypothetical protein
LINDQNSAQIQKPKGITPMIKNFASQFRGFAFAALTFTCFATASFAGTGATGAAAAQGPQQVVVTNSTAQPVPMSGLVYVQNSAAQPIPVQDQGKQYFQATQVGNCSNTGGIIWNFNVPSGKTLVLQHVNVWAISDPGQTFGVQAYADDLSFWYLPTQPLGGFSQNSWTTDQHVQILANQHLKVTVQKGIAGGTCGVNLSISGELIPAQQTILP